ncbi:MAG TPA: prolyl oligopeptidase family serine peptidase [Jatrophihabitantaceae bacterium]
MSFDDLAAYAALPRLTGLALSLDGSRLVATLQQPDAKGARYTSSLWEIDLDGGAPTRLTFSDKGEAAPAFRPDGSLLFVSSRPDVTGAGEDEDEAALWCLPPAGEPRVLARRPGGIGGPVVAASSGDVVLSGSRLAYSTDADDAERRKARKDRKISAILHTGMPIRYWDHELGDTSTRLLLLDEPDEPRDLAPDATIELTEPAYTISADGTTIAARWRTRRPNGRFPDAVSLIDVATGKRTMLAAQDGMQYIAPVIAPDGTRVAVSEERDGSFERPLEAALVILPVAEGEPVRVALGDLYPTEWVWAADSGTLFVTGDRHGRGAVLAVDPGTGAVRTELAADACYGSLQPSPDGSALYALRSAMDSPPTPVRLAADGTLTVLATPAPVPELPGELIELSVPARDGAEVHGWLCLPPESGTPAPVMLWIHGGPFGSWNSWSWRWNPWVAVAHGWAVVLPDPALSTGYGQRWLERAWPYVAAEVFADCAAVLDSALQRPGLDAERVACLGASFGGYMTNWVAGHVDRFEAIVTHAGLYALDQQHKTTDAAEYKTGIFGEPAEHPEWYAANSPDRGSVGGTPMLVVHGSRDYRVPVSEALRLWWDLVSGWDGEPDDMPHRFLQLTGENHWVLSPANVEIWYDAVLGFCAQQVLGRPWTPSALL